MARSQVPSGTDPKMTTGGADPTEIGKFDRLAAEWWDEAGPMGALHRINPVRLGYLRQQMVAHLGVAEAAPRPLEGIEALDVGCGAGLLTEPLARLGARVTGIDLAGANLEVAAAHAAESGLAIDYRRTPAEVLVEGGEAYDLVCCLEVVEHVAKPEALLTTCAALVRPGGALVMSTLNRTLRSFALGIVAAEWVLGWLPRGTHQWGRFVRPAEAARPLRRAGLTVSDVTGMTYDPLRDRFQLSDDPAVNYLLFAVRPPAAS
jgi:2-polyprenyl-6-hydroxyphenyl methylase/3-demethylubiquinone-9 3-methyltransferase